MGFKEAVKNLFKHILPPPVTSFMREVNNLNDSIWRSKGELSGQVAAASRRLEAGMGDQARQIARLVDLFESANRENQRIFEQSRRDCATLRADYVRANEALAAQLSLETERNSRLERQLGDACASLEGLLGAAQALRCESAAQRELLESLGHRIDEQRETLGVQNAILGRIDRSGAGVRDALSQARRSIQTLTTRQAEWLDPALYAHALSLWYQDVTGRVLDLEHPRTFNEKIQWMKLYDADSRKTLLADKVEARGWVEKRIGSRYLVPLLGVFDHATDIDFDRLPSRFVIKANHGSGWNAVVRDKACEDLESLRWRLDSWLKTNFAFVNGFEMHYSAIPRRLLIEEYLCNADGDLPDYKFWCFDGKVRFVQFLAGRQTELKMLFFDREWNVLPFTYDHPRYEGEVARPENLDEMIGVAESLAQGFAFVRVDLYRLDDGSIQFGEMTFSPASGVCRWNVPGIDEALGDLLELSFVASEPSSAPGCSTAPDMKG